ncbi:MAG: hypothetical protein NTV34_10005 [Proteobacteria bacterium]|nr:hypothetical protein [Pseudomonadota bacterium]
MKSPSLNSMAAFILTTLLNCSPSALAGTWCHAFLKATDGTEIQIDYQIAQYQPMRMPNYWAMKNIYVHARSQLFQGNENVSIVFMTPWNGARPEGGSEIRELPFDGQRYTAAGTSAAYGDYVSIIRPVGPLGYYHGESAYHFEVAIVVDNVWLKDPVTRESNFRLYADAYPNLCANP